MFSWVRILIVCFAALALSISTKAQVLVLRADRSLDVVQGRITAGAVVVIEGGRIIRVGGNQFPAGAEILDLGDVTLLPGLIDVHSHLLYSGLRRWEPVWTTPADLAFNAAYHARSKLQAGFTTVRDVYGWAFVDVSLMRAIEAGIAEGPRIIPVGHSLGITGGHCGDVIGFAPGTLELGPKEGVADGVDEVIKAVRYQIKHGARWIKTCASPSAFGEKPMNSQEYSEEELRAMVEEARRHGVKVAAHAQSSQGALAAIRAGAASIEHGANLTEEAIELMKRNHTYLVPTASIFQGPQWESARESHRRAIRAGIKIAFGTDAPPDRSSKEFLLLTELGLSPIEAVRAATINAAQLLETADRGVIESGRLADVIAVAGNPLEDIRVLENVLFVMKDGKIYRHPDR